MLSHAQNLDWKPTDEIDTYRFVKDITGKDTSEVARDANGRFLLGETVVIKDVHPASLDLKNIRVDTLIFGGLGWADDTLNIENLTIEESQICQLKMGVVISDFVGLFVSEFDIIDIRVGGGADPVRVSLIGSTFSRGIFDVTEIELEFIRNVIVPKKRTNVADFLEDTLFQNGVVDDSTFRGHRSVMIQNRSREPVDLFFMENTDSSEFYQDSRLGSMNSITIYGAFKNLRLTGNTMNHSLKLGDFYGLKVEENINISKNKFSSLIMESVSFGESYTYLPFNQFLEEPKLFIYTDNSQDELASGFSSAGGQYPYFGMLEREIEDETRFFKLIKAHAQLYNVYKADGDIISANEVYARMQKLYTKRYALLARDNGTLKHIFRWRLNQILDFYVAYGTDPAKAMVISFYILVVFSIFYFFFPSEWDITSKEKLLQQVKASLSKKKKGTFKSLMKSFGLFLLSYLNAFTLSLNAFVTLGFGTIPTRGAARYVCILQGFLGWFLLSLFSVALINQVIF